jgi:hypothetical protein
MAYPLIVRTLAQIDLPVYPNAEVLRDKLMFAMQNACDRFDIA